jgi:hypothetical protein
MTSLPFPLTDPKYKLFLSDSNKNKDIVINVKNYLTTLNTYLNKFIEEQTNTSKLSSYIQSMEQSSNLILSTIKNCASSTDPNKCKSIVCELNKEIQLIIFDLIVKFQSITSTGIKKQYNFLPLILTNSIAKIITDNDKNKYRNGKFYLCDAFEISPPDPNGQLFSDYQELVEDAEVLKESNDKQVLINNIITWLQYLAILIIVITTIVIVYNKFFKKKADVILNKIGGYLSKYN